MEQFPSVCTQSEHQFQSVGCQLQLGINDYILWAPSFEICTLWPLLFVNCAQVRIKQIHAVCVQWVVSSLRRVIILEGCCNLKGAIWSFLNNIPLYIICSSCNNSIESFLISRLQMLKYVTIKKFLKVWIHLSWIWVLPPVKIISLIYSRAYHVGGITMEDLRWATSHENVSLGIFDQVRFKPACSPTETS